MSLYSTFVFSFSNQSTTLLIAFLLISCGPKQTSEDYRNALAIYQETIELEIEVRAIRRSLEQVVAQDSSLLLYSSELADISSALDQWENDVLNMAEANTELLGHEHPVNAALPDRELLLAQTSLSERLKKLAARMENLMEKMSR